MGEDNAILNTGPSFAISQPLVAAPTWLTLFMSLVAYALIVKDSEEVFFFARRFLLPVIKVILMY